MKIMITTDDGELLEIIEDVQDRIATPIARADLGAEIVETIANYIRYERHAQAKA